MRANPFARTRPVVPSGVVVPSPAAVGEPAATMLAPSPAIDRVPTVIGGGMTLAYISAVMRSATDGQREAWVDLLDELLERDPHAFSVLSKRILAVAGGRLEVTPAVTEENDPEYEQAREIASFVSAQISALADLPTILSSLLWSLYYGIGGAELLWERSGTEWTLRGVERIHPRRFWYPDRGTWDLYISVGWDAQHGRVTQGFRVLDYPGKFIIHAPVLRGDSPTREGLGRELAFWLAMKAVAARAAVQYVEGYSRPRPIGSYATGDDGKTRAAGKLDIAAAKDTLTALGLGTLSSALLPDSIKIDHHRVDGGITHEAWIGICNSEVTKAVLQNTGTTEIGKNGSRAQAETMRDDQQGMTRFDAANLAATFRRDVITPLVRLNYPSLGHLAPRVAIHATEDPNPMKTLAMAQIGVDVGLPIDADKLGAMVGLPLVSADDLNARRLQRPAPKGAPPMPPANDTTPAADAAAE